MPCASQLLPSRDVRPAVTLLPADLLLLPYTCLAMMDTVEPGCVRTVLDNAATLVGVSYHGKTKLPQLHSTSIAFHTFGVTSFHHLREPKDPRGSHIACHVMLPLTVTAKRTRGRVHVNPFHPPRYCLYSTYEAAAFPRASCDGPFSPRRPVRTPDTGSLISAAN